MAAEVDERPKLLRCLSDDHIYDEPYVGGGSLKSYSSDETLVLSNIIYDRISCEDGTDGEGRPLHYACTPVLKIRPRSFSPKEKKPSFKSWPKPLIGNRNHEAAKQNVLVRELISHSFSSVRKKSNENAGEEDSGGSDNELTANEVERRINYMRTVSRAHSIRVKRPHVSDPTDPRIFDSVIVVGLRYSDNECGSFVPYVKLSYPTKLSAFETKNCSIVQFCFPDAESWKPSESGETYTFVLTNQKGDRTYGYCKRIKIDEMPVSLPIVYCVLSPVLSFTFYSKILDELERRHGCTDAEKTTFLDTLHHWRVPKPGRSFWIPTLDSTVKQEIYRPTDTAIDDTGVESLLKKLDITNVLKVYAALLLERRIVLYSATLNSLSRCVHAFVSLLYPFVWQHTFIPILPVTVVDVIGSPTPFVVGILSQFVSKLRDFSSDSNEVLMVDLDHNRLFHESGDELKVIPKKIQKALTIALKMAKSSPETASLVTVEAFLRMFVETVGHYGNFIVTQQDGKRVFERDAFCNAVQSEGTATFLQWFTETQMFNVFIDAKIEGTGVACLSFDKRIQEYKDELENVPQSLRDNFKDFGKKVKTLGERLIGFKTPDKHKVPQS